MKKMIGAVVLFSLVFALGATEARIQKQEGKTITPEERSRRQAEMERQLLAKAYESLLGVPGERRFTVLYYFKPEARNEVLGLHFRRWSKRVSAEQREFLTRAIHIVERYDDLARSPQAQQEFDLLVLEMQEVFPPSLLKTIFEEFEPIVDADLFLEASSQKKRGNIVTPEEQSLRQSAIHRHFLAKAYESLQGVPGDRRFIVLYHFTPEARNEVLVQHFRRWSERVSAEQRELLIRAIQIVESHEDLISSEREPPEFGLLVLEMKEVFPPDVLERMSQFEPIVEVSSFDEETELEGLCNCNKGSSCSEGTNNCKTKSEDDSACQTVPLGCGCLKWWACNGRGNKKK